MATTTPSTPGYARSAMPPRWALVVETAGYNPRAGNLIDVVHTFGNCLTSGAPGYEDLSLWHLSRRPAHRECERADAMRELTVRDLLEQQTPPVWIGLAMAFASALVTNAAYPLERDAPPVQAGGVPDP